MQSPTVNRRQVLQGMAAAAISAPIVIPSTALGNADTPPPSERITMAHIGVGNQGRYLFGRFLQCKGSQSVAVSDCYQDRRESAAAQCKGKAYADFQEMLARTDIDAVVVASPDHWHVPLALAVARSGKDAYVEKPLGICIEQDLLCRKVFKEKNRVFQYGTQQRSSKHCRLGCELVRNGKIGKVTAIDVVAPNGGAGGSTQEIPVPQGLDYDRWIGPAPMKPFTASRCNPPGTYWIYDYSIGYLGGWGAHPLDIMVWGSDVDLSGPMTVEGTGEIAKEGLFDTVFNWDCKIQTAAGVPITFKPGGDLTTFIGEKGKIAISRGGIKADPPAVLQEKLEEGAVRLIDSPNHYQNFVDAVRTRGKTVSNIEDAVRSDIVSHLCDIAIRLKRKVTWDPKQEVIVGDDEATKMLSRPMRAPWKLEG